MAYFSECLCFRHLSDCPEYILPKTISLPPSLLSFLALLPTDNDPDLNRLTVESRLRVLELTSKNYLFPCTKHSSFRDFLKEVGMPNEEAASSFLLGIEKSLIYNLYSQQPIAIPYRKNPYYYPLILAYTFAHFFQEHSLEGNITCETPEENKIFTGSLSPFFKTWLRVQGISSLSSLNCQSF